MHISASVYVCVCVRICTCYMSMCIYIYTHTHIYIYIYTRMYVYVQIVTQEAQDGAVLESRGFFGLRVSGFLGAPQSPGAKKGPRSGVSRPQAVMFAEVPSTCFSYLKIVYYNRI